MNRFGEQLRSSMIKDYFWHYIAYDDLKDALKTQYVTDPSPSNPKPDRKPWTESDERRFVALLESELDKVATFQSLKSNEIIQRIKASEREVNHVVSRLDIPASGSRRASERPTDEDFLLLEADLSDIIADVHDLAKFTQLNYTGFQKIIKKHDKQTMWYLKPVFATRLNAKPFFKDNYDAFVVKLSRLYDLVRTKGNPVKGDSSAGGGQQNFIRQTTKYWVHPDNITELKLIVLKHLPVLVFNPSKEFEEKDSAITSIYYDNPDTWELYKGRLQKTEGAEAIRLRWYGGMDVDQIFVERKTHREDWTGEKSVKARFPMKEKYVNSYLSGDMTVGSVFEKMRKDGKKSEQQIADWEALAKEVQYRAVTRNLQPVCRTFYHRTAFQLPGDARVRISLDTELSMIREDNLDGRRRAGDNWRRMDIGIDWPFRQLPPEDIERFPYAVLEVKLQTQAGQEPPQWIRDLTASHLVEAVPKFSKFIHGCATLFPDKINLLPFWFPQMDVDIRKPVTHDDDDETDDEVEQRGDNTATDGTQIANPAIYERRLTEATRNELDVEERVGVDFLAGDEDYPLYDSDDESDFDDALEEARRVGGPYYYRMLLSSYLQRTGHITWEVLKAITPRPRATQIPEAGSNGITVLGTGKRTVKRFTAPKGKRIHVPIRVEPKVYFAAERTFLSWLEFSILIGSIAATLLNFGSDYVTFASAWIFTTIAIMCLLYSVMLYVWRVDKIRKRRDVKRIYYEKWGPTMLCLGLLLAVLVNFILRVRHGNGIASDNNSQSQNQIVANMSSYDMRGLEL
ncbi:Vacuolar transporter chaperone 4 [Talaromyces atroroseus]|uniref:Vacuolar transporter chaperone complex subunit 4 n=1 Tax=Talaromyces atroroseus TaxID=1441469 RepID=A0A1Q5Q7A7_TALAT|nr:Vacuolar transporter chaperone 4 [Talaromyces atroroseus]OKL55620.1 Vacuolar transporter chaperone 4 [Talaromyces atroroseus]